MKKYLGFLLAALLCIALTAAAFAADVYVTNGGTGDGSSEAAPMGNMTDAINKIGEAGGTVHIVGSYRCEEQFVEPYHKGDIVIDGGRYIFANGSFNRWILVGEGSTEFRNITFEYEAGTTSLIVAQYNPLILGEGLSFPSAGKCYVIGGYQAESGVKLAEQERIRNFDYAHDSHITIKSGNLWCVAGFNRGGGAETFTGTSHITVEGGNISTLYGANVSGNYAQNAEITVNGGTVDQLFAAGEKTRRLNGDCLINVKGGTVNQLMLNNTLGTIIVNYEGGKIGSAEKSMAAFSDEPDVSGATTVLNVAGVHADSIKAAFDTVNTAAPAGEPTTPDTPAAPEKTVVKLTIGVATGYINDEAKPLDAAPIIRNSRTMLPVRFLAEAFGAEVGWDGATSTATVTAAGVDIRITIAANEAIINGATVALDSPAFIENSRTYLPVRVIADALGAEVAWDGATSTATLTK